MAPLTTFSVALGYLSIGCWLGAQFPQVVENIRRRSCEGLALPFLINWLLGDISNLIGCLLTHQLPFQTWLATYFVIVDFTLFGQYFYYQHVNPFRMKTRRMSVDRTTPRYRTLSAAAANVAAAAALAAQHDEHSGFRRAKWPQTSRETFFDRSGSRISREEGEVIDEAALADSFHSEGGSTMGQKRVSWSTERYGGRRGTSVGGHAALTRSAFLPPPSHSAALESAAESLGRGRTLQRDTSRVDEHGVMPSTSVGRSSRASRQTASGIVFLGVFALFGVGSLTGNRHVLSMSSAYRTGRVLTPRAMELDSLSKSPSNIDLHSTVPTAQINEYSISTLDSSSNSDNYTLINIPPVVDMPKFEPKIVEDSNERIIGRIFAWVCTTLYLTSRLPQIWKNFVRKSVEGLSMYLFIFAFLGNTFYVASILTSPEMFEPAPKSSAFIKESIPYLLGSSGTLVFDITIVAQSFIYRPKPRRHRHGHRSTARAAEEEGGLLAGDVLAHPSQESEVHSRGRTHDQDDV